MQNTRAKFIQTREITMKGVFLLSSIFSIFALLVITGFLFYSAVPAFRDVGFFDLLFGKIWRPSANATNQQFGIVPFVLGSVYVTILSTVIGVPFGVLTAIFLYKFCPKKLCGAIRQMINLLASIPSVVYGLFAMIFIIPLLRQISPGGQGEGILAASIVLSIMILPTIVSISLNALNSVPKTIFEGALALGATKEQAVFKAVLRGAKSGVLASVVLAIGRALGETMAVVMVIGLNSNIPTSILAPANTMTAVIASEFMESGSDAHANALIAVGLVLFLFALVLNVTFSFVKNRKARESKTDKPAKRLKFRLPKLPKLSVGYSKITNKVLRVVSCAMAALAVLSLVGIVVFILIKGVPYVNLHFIFGEYSTKSPTLKNSLLGTLYLMLISIPIAFPIGIGAAIFLAEYAAKSRLTRYIKVAIETLAGIPSIVYGIFGYTVFVVASGWGKSLLGGGITLAVMMLPLVIRTVEESLLAVPQSLREGAQALGAGKVRTTFCIVLPNAIGGIVSAFVLSIGRVVSECAMLILTIGMILNNAPSGVFSSGSTLALSVYYFFQDNRLDLAAATCVVLLVIVLAINILAALLERFIGKRRRG